MKEYKFSDLIDEVQDRNTNLEFGLDDIVGVTIEKGLIPTIANLTQTALDKFYLVKQNTFVYNPRTHGVRLGMGFNESNKTYITSWNNIAFRVKESAKETVLPKFLWIYFNRSEWDRQTNFLAWGSSTIVFAWNDFLNIRIKLPDIKEQQKIVDTYNAITNRIQIKQKINENLEKTAQAIYRKMFIEDADENWETVKLCNISKMFAGGDKPEVFSEIETEKCNIPIYSNGLVNYGLYGFTDKPRVTEESITVSARGTIGFPCLRLEPYVPIIRLISVIPNKEITNAMYLYYFLKNTQIVSSGTTQQQLTVPEFGETMVLIPDENKMSDFEKKVRILYLEIKSNEKEIASLSKIKYSIISQISGKLL